MNAQSIILAGGKSSRFGSDKALAKIEGVTLLEWAVRLLERLELAPTIITSSFQDYSFLSCRVEKDLLPNKGPLGGLYTALSLFSNASMLVLTCDMPCLTEFSLRYLIENHKPENLITIYQLKGEKLQPFPGIYEGSLAKRVLERLHMNQLSLHGFLESVRETQYLQPKEPLDLFRNVNIVKFLPA